jgi:hypothetical protein
MHISYKNSGKDKALKRRAKLNSRSVAGEWNLKIPDEMSEP